MDRIHELVTWLKKYKSVRPVFWKTIQSEDAAAGDFEGKAAYMRFLEQKINKVWANAFIEAQRIQEHTQRDLSLKGFAPRVLWPPQVMTEVMAVADQFILAGEALHIAEPTPETASEKTASVNSPSKAQRRKVLAKRMAELMGDGSTKSQAIKQIAQEWDTSISTLWKDLHHIRTVQRDKPNL